MKYVGNVDSYLYFSFKLVGIRHIIQRIAFKISAVACERFAVEVTKEM